MNPAYPFKRPHLYTLHHTYTGKGCAICGKDASDHSAASWLVEGKEIERCDHRWEEQPGEPPIDVCSSCGEVRS